MASVCHDCHIIHDVAGGAKRRRSVHDLVWWRRIKADFDTFVTQNLRCIRTANREKLVPSAREAKTAEVLYSKSGESLGTAREGSNRQTDRIGTGVPT